MFVKPTGIAISFGGSADGTGQSRPVVARIYGFAAGSESGEAIVRDMVVPAGGFIEEDLPHGFYNVQLRLPSGRVLQRNVTIDEYSHETYQFFEDFAPSAGFSLQEAVQQSPDQIIGCSASSSRNATVLAPVDSDGSETNDKTQLVLLLGTRPSLDAPPDIARGVPMKSAREEGNAALWHLSSNEASPPRTSTRRWARVALPGGRVELASLPLPWFCAMSGQHIPAQVLVDPARSGGAATSVAIQDDRLGGLLSYLDRGQAKSAGPLLEQIESENVIEDAIRGKMANPLAACAAAYVGLAVYDPREREVWDHWLGNCMVRFPTIADAAIVHARRLILRPTGPDDNAEAAKALDQACQAGIPYFSAGVALLREMILVLSPDHPHLASHAEWAERLAGRVDPTQAFTVLRYAPRREETP